MSPRNGTLVRLSGLVDFVDAAEHDGLAVVDQHRGVDLALVELRHLTAAGVVDEAVQRILLHIEIQDRCDRLR